MDGKNAHFRWQTWLTISSAIVSVLCSTSVPLSLRNKSFVAEVFFIPFEFPILLSKVCLFYSYLIPQSHTAKGIFARCRIRYFLGYPWQRSGEVKIVASTRIRTNNLPSWIFWSGQLHHHPVIFRPSINKTGLPGGLGASACSCLRLEPPWAQSLILVHTVEELKLNLFLDTSISSFWFLREKRWHLWIFRPL